MPIYRVEHRLDGRCFFCRAETAGEAVERVMLRLGDAEAPSAWTACEDASRTNLGHGAVVDADGRLVPDLEA